MKKFAFLFILLLPLMASAQTDSARLSMQERYCMLVTRNKVFSSKVTIQVDFGQESSWWKTTPGEKIRDEAGKVVKFNSAVDALNYMSSKGWRYVNAYVVENGSGQKELHYILRRLVDEQ